MLPPDDEYNALFDPAFSERLRKALQARFGHLSPEKQLRLKVDLLRFLSQSQIRNCDPVKPPEDGENE
jgi:hypothetical protein